MKKKLSVFDLDHTLITENSSFCFSYFLLRKRLLSAPAFLLTAWHYFRHLFLGLPLEKLHQNVFSALLKGFSPDLLKEQIEQFLTEYILPNLYMPALAQLRFAQQRGEYTAIFSSSPHFLVEPIAHFLHVDRFEATSYRVNAKRELTDLLQIVDGEQKAALLRKLQEELEIAGDQTTAYSDSYTDLPFLLAAGASVAVNPDKALQKYARAHHWPIL